MQDTQRFGAREISFGCDLHRALTSRPGWRIVTLVCEAFDSKSDKVIEFESAVLVKASV